MILNKKKIKLKDIQIIKPSLSIQLKKNQNKKAKEINLSKLSPQKNEMNLKLMKNKKSLDNEEYGFELNQSSESNGSNDQENNGVIIPFNEKSNGENKDETHKNIQNNIINNFKKEFIFLPITKNNNNKIKSNIRKNINFIDPNNQINKYLNDKNKKLLYNYSNNINNDRYNNSKDKNNLVDSNWNHQKINFDGISTVSKGNSYDNYNNENFNIIDNNYLNSPKSSINTLITSDNFDLNNNNFKYLKHIKGNQNSSSIITNNNNMTNINNININKNNISKENLYYKEINNNSDNNMIEILKKEKNNLEEQLEKEKKINKEKNNYIEILKKEINDNILLNKNIIINTKDKQTNEMNSLDLLLEFSKYKLENEKIKKSLIIQNILIEEMKNELLNLKKDKKLLEEEISLFNNNYNKLKENLNEYELQLKEKKNNEKYLTINLNKQKNKCFGQQKEIKTLKQKIDELIEINEKLTKEKCLEEYKKIINEKNNDIKDLKNQNNDLVKKIKLKDKELNLQINNKENLINKNIEIQRGISKSNEMEIDQNKKLEINTKIVIDELYKNIKEISDSIKINYNNFSENYLINTNNTIEKFLKEIIENINTDNNGNISLDKKIKTINKFNDILKININSLFNKINPIKKEYNKNNSININKNNNLFISPNGQNSCV